MRLFNLLANMTFFKNINTALVNENDSIVLVIQKTGEQLTTSTVIKSGGKEIVFSASGTPEEMDDNYLADVSKADVKVKAYVSSVDKAEPKESEDEDDSKASKKKENSKPKKKEEAKKDTKAKPDPKKDTKEEVKDDTAKQKKLEEDAEKMRKAAEEKKKKEEEAKRKIDFDALIAAGKIEFDQRRYEDSEVTFKKALALFPEDKDAQRHFENSKKWVDRLIDNKIIEKRKED